MWHHHPGNISRQLNSLTDPSVFLEYYYHTAHPNWKHLYSPPWYILFYSVLLHRQTLHLIWGNSLGFWGLGDYCIRNTSSMMECKYLNGSQDKWIWTVNEKLCIQTDILYIQVFFFWALHWLTEVQIRVILSGHFFALRPFYFTFIDTSLYLTAAQGGHKHVTLSFCVSESFSEWVGSLLGLFSSLDHNLTGWDIC